jgi:hypothetical protein
MASFLQNAVLETGVFCKMRVNLILEGLQCPLMAFEIGVKVDELESDA